MKSGLPLQRDFRGRLHPSCMTTHPKHASSKPGRIAVAAALVAVAAALAGMLVAPSPVRAEEPVRSGTIHGGVGETPISPWVRGMEGCVGAPTCSAWLQSGCDPALAGMEPALQAAVVDVGDLADNTERTLTLHGDLVVFGNRYTVQFWINSDDPLSGYWCEEIFDLRFRPWDCPHDYIRFECPVRIPPHAKWMTITASPETAAMSWTLT